MQSIYKTFLRVGVVFRDESSDSNYSVIVYSNVRVTILYPLVDGLVRFVRFLTQGF